MVEKKESAKKAEKAKKGDLVVVHYTGTLGDGTVFDSSEGKDPLSFPLGAGMVIKGFEDAIEGMAVGEEKEVHLTKDEAYGDPNPELVKEIPKAALEGSNIELKVGIVLAFKVDQTGQVIPGKVMKIGDETITIDINPPLAGKNLNFKIKLVDVKDAPKEEPKQEPKCEPEEGDACGCGHEH